MTRTGLRIGAFLLSGARVGHGDIARGGAGVQVTLTTPQIPYIPKP